MMVVGVMGDFAATGAVGRPVAPGVFSRRYKVGHVTPLLKKRNLDKADPANYRPITNLVTVSKLLEKLFWLASALTCRHRGF